MLLRLVRFLATKRLGMLAILQALHSRAGWSGIIREFGPVQCKLALTDELSLLVQTQLSSTDLSGVNDTFKFAIEIENLGFPLSQWFNI
jgi:hypothetical protein